MTDSSAISISRERTSRSDWVLMASRSTSLTSVSTDPSGLLT